MAQTFVSHAPFHYFNGKLLRKSFSAPFVLNMKRGKSAIVSNERP
jgi:hypothetical protein